MNYKIPALILCFFILTMSSEESYGGHKSAGVLHTECTTAKSDEFYFVYVSECRGYVIGVMDTWQLGVKVGFVFYSVPRTISKI